MTPFIELSAAARSLFALWTLLLCLANIASAVLSAVKKRYRFIIFALILYAPVYFLWQMIFDIYLFRGTDGISSPSAFAGGLPWTAWLSCACFLTFLTVFLLEYSVRYDRSFITPGAIKSFLDKVPCGVCCWRRNGRVLFSNVCMDRLCAAITGGRLQNGNFFCDKVKDGIVAADGGVWRFSRRELELDGEKLFEMTASDVTAEYAETEALKKDKERLSHLNDVLNEYTLGIDESVRRREILQAKINIHDEMNRLMLSTVAAKSADVPELDRIFSLWKQNALLLCMDADGSPDVKAMSRIEKLADMLNIKLIKNGAVPSELTEKQSELFYSAAQEALANAAKHAQAKTLEIAFEEDDDRIVCRFTNDGNVPKGGVRFSGGLANLSLLAKKQNASVSAGSGENFTLSLIFNKNQPNG